MKRFMYFSIGTLCLSIAMFVGFQIGTRNAVAQPSTFTWIAIVNPQIGNGIEHFAMLPNGDLYRRQSMPFNSDPPLYVGNFWNGGPVPTSGASLGTVKAQYRK